MNKIKNIVVFLITLSLIILNINTVGATTEQKSETLEKYRQELLLIKKGPIYLKQINKLVDKIDDAKAKKILKKITLIENKLIGKTDKRTQNILLILNVLKETINSKLDNLSTESKLSPEEKETIEKEIKRIQLNLFSSSKNIIKKLSKNFNELSNSEEKGNLKMNLDIDYEDFGTLKAESQLKNYSIKNNFLDSNFETQLSINIDSKLKNELEQKLKINSDIDYIKKDGIEYLLVKNFKILDKKGFEKFEEYLKTFEDIAKKNKYIELENSEADTNLIKNLQKINPKKIIYDTEVALSKPFLEPYSRVGNKYYLKPTRYACDKIKELSNKFDPINGKKCSDSQYQDILKKVSKYGNLYMIKGEKNNKLIYEYKKTHKLDSGIISIEFDNKNVKSVSVDIVPNQKRFVDEGFKFNYTSKENLDIWFNADKGTKYLNLQSKLSNFNSFKSMELAIKSKGKRDEFRLGYKLGNSKINGNIDYIINSYNWESDKYTQSNVFNANISGTRNNWKLSMNNKDIKNQTNTLTSNLKYINGNLSGITNINKKDKTNILKINHNGKIDINYFELNNKITFSKDFTKDIIKTNKEGKQTNYNLEENINLIIDNKNNKNNFYLLINALLNTKEILKFELINTSKKTYKDMKIKKPLNTIKLEDISK